MTVDATIGNQQVFGHDGCNIFPGLSYKKAKYAFSDSVRKNNVGAQVEFSLKFTKRARVPVIDVTVKKDLNYLLTYYLLKFFGILAGRCGSVVIRERDYDTKGLGSRPGLTLGCHFLSFSYKNSQ